LFGRASFAIPTVSDMSDHDARGGGPPIEVRGLTKWFGDVTALDRVDCVVERATVHGLVGANGAGKTTLLAVLFGLVRPDEGDVRLFGRTRREAGAAWLDSVGGFVESPRFYPYLTGRANLAVFAGLDRGDSAALIDPVLDLVGLAEGRNQKVKGYSLGMRQRLGLAAAIIRRPSLLILDEPTNGLDPAGISSLRDALRAVRERGTAVLFSSHDIGQVDELCDDVTVLDRGAVVFSGSAERLRAEAPQPDWRMRTSNDTVAIELAATVGVQLRAAGEGTGGGLHVAVGQAELDRFVIALGRAGVAVRSLEQAASPLEVLMGRLTGMPVGTESVPPVAVVAS
jgi:ABC-2 type transport system ATP-binding protein